MNVYLVWGVSGGVDGVFSTREKAEEYVDSEVEWMSGEVHSNQETLRRRFYIEERQLDYIDYGSM
jgi:hypothetical protein